MEKDNTTIPEVVIAKENVEAKSPESIQKGESTNSINWDEINRQKHYRFQNSNLCFIIINSLT